MDILPVIGSVVFFISSIILFFVKNGVRKLTLKQIIILSSHQLKRDKPDHLIVFSTLSDFLLIFSVVSLIIYLNYLPAFILILGGVVVVFFQKVIIWLLSRILRGAKIKNRLYGQNILFYLSWTIMFTLVSLIAIRPEKLTVGIIFVAFIISAISSVPATHNFLKSLHKKGINDGDVINLGLLSGEKVISKANAGLKRGIILLGGILCLTDRHLLFVGTEFFDRDKKIFCLPLHSIAQCELDDHYRLKIRENSGKVHTIVLEGAFKFVSTLNDALR